MRMERKLPTTEGRRPLRAESQQATISFSEFITESKSPIGTLAPRYNKHMKRTNLVLDEQLLITATHLLAAKTYSAAVNTALAEVIRMRNMQSLPNSFGTGIWEGDLQQMREDFPTRRRGRK